MKIKAVGQTFLWCPNKEQRDATHLKHLNPVVTAAITGGIREIFRAYLHCRFVGFVRPDVKRSLGQCRHRGENMLKYVFIMWNLRFRQLQLQLCW